jgi:hypothetical protein
MSRIDVTSNWKTGISHDKKTDMPSRDRSRTPKREPVENVPFKALFDRRASGGFNEVLFGTNPVTGQQIVLRRAKGERSAAGEFVPEDDDLRNLMIQEAAFATLLADHRIHPKILCWNVYEASVLMEHMQYPSLTEAWTNVGLRVKIVRDLGTKLAEVAQLGICLQDMKDGNVVVSSEGDVRFIDVDVQAVLFVDKFSTDGVCSDHRDASQIVTFFFNVMLMQLLQSCLKEPSLVKSCVGMLRVDADFLRVLKSYKRKVCQENLNFYWKEYNPDLTMSEAWEKYRREAGPGTRGLLRSNLVLPHFFDRKQAVATAPSDEAIKMAAQLNEYYVFFQRNTLPCPGSAQIRLTSKSPSVKYRSRPNVGPSLVDAHVVASRSGV